MSFTMEQMQRRFGRWLQAENKELIELTLQERLELLAFGVSPCDITQ